MTADTMKLRPANRDDIHWLATLWAHAFPGERNVAERARQLEDGGPYGGIDTVRVAEREGARVGACKLLALRQRLGGATLPMLGLAAVAVAPEARRGGAGRTLCRLALREGRDRGDVVSALYAFRPEYYRSLGWALAGELHSYRFQPEQLRVPSAPTPAVRLATIDDYGGIADCYARFFARSNGAIERGAAAWQHHLSGSDCYAWVLGGGRSVRGYMLVTYGSGSSREHRVLHIRELVADDDDAYDALLAWIAQQRDLWRHVVYEAAPDEHFPLRLIDPRPPGYRPQRGLWDPVARVLRGPMLRLLDVRSALQQRVIWGDAAPCRFTIDARDAELPANERRLSVEWDGSRAHVEEGGAAGGVTIVAGTGTLAQIYAGVLSVSAACRLGLAEADGSVRALDRLFSEPAGYTLLDEF